MRKSKKSKNTGTTDALRKLREYEFERDVLAKSTNKESLVKQKGRKG